MKSTSGESWGNSSPSHAEVCPEKTFLVSSEGPVNTSLAIYRVCAPHPDHSKPPMETADGFQTRFQAAPRPLLQQGGKGKHQRLASLSPDRGNRAEGSNELLS